MVWFLRGWWEKMYKETIKDLSEEYYKDGKGKRYLGYNNLKKDW